MLTPLLSRTTSMESKVALVSFLSLTDDEGEEEGQEEEEQLKGTYDVFLEEIQEHELRKLEARKGKVSTVRVLGTLGRFGESGQGWTHTIEYTEPGEGEGGGGEREGGGGGRWRSVKTTE